VWSSDLANSKNSLRTTESPAKMMSFEFRHEEASVSVYLCSMHPIAKDEGRVRMTYIFKHTAWLPILIL
jgi:hypothetical protein